MPLARTSSVALVGVTLAYIGAIVLQQKRLVDAKA